MLAIRIRSGLEETYHDGAVAVSDPDGSLVASFGDIDRPFYLRSSAKPFQAAVSQASGANLAPVELAVASASHHGHPVHVAIVESILAAGDLVEDDLQCPETRPLSSSASVRLAGAGALGERRVWHNCSGKHAGFLRACVANEWPTTSYLEPDHPLQARVLEMIAELGNFDPGPVGVDGCGAPVFRTTARVMARLYAQLGSSPELREVYGAMHSYPALISANGAGDASIATALDAVAKGGAQGCLGVALRDGLGVSVKSWDGLGEVAVVGAIEALRQMGRLASHPASTLGEVAAPPVLGGGRVTGRLEPRLTLQVA